MRIGQLMTKCPKTCQLKELQVGDAMAKEVRACNPGDSLVEAKLILREVRARRLPVVDESEQVIGVLSQADLGREAARKHGSEKHEITESRIGEVLAAICERGDIGGSSHE